MAAIVELFTGDSSLQLEREQYIRPMLIGHNWDKVRVGIHYSMQVPSTDTRTYITMAYGLTCQSKQWWDAGADMAYTLYANSSLVAAPTFYMTAANGSYGLGMQDNVVNQTKVGAVISTSSPGNVASIDMSYTVRGMLFSDISRQAGQLIFKPWGRAGSAPTDQLLSNFLVDMEMETGPLFCTTTSLPAGAVTYNGTGLLDSFWFYWGNSIPVISLHAIAVCRFY